MDQYVVVAEDRLGLLADIAELLAKNKINIDSLSGDVVNGKAVIRILCRTRRPVKEILANAGYEVLESEAVIVKLKNKPGEISRIARKLADDEINIKNVRMLIEGENEGYYALEVDKPKKAMKILEEYVSE